MLFDLPDAATLYSALIARDPTLDGRAYGGGIWRKQKLIELETQYSNS